MTVLSDAQRASLAARLRQGRSAAGSIPRRGEEVRELPLSFGQEQLWFIDQLAPGLPVYNIASALRLRGSLDAAALGRALDDVVARHEALRTRLVNVEGRPLQVIDPPRARTLAIDDLSGSEQSAREGRLRELAEQEAAHPFDLATGPLFRARLVRISAHEHVLLMVVHHTVFDGWSFEVFIRELAAFYQAQVSGRAAELQDLPVQFADYALWERQRLQGRVLEDLVSYWRTALDDVSTVEMPTDRPRPRLQSFDGGVQRLDIEAGVLEDLKAVSRRTGSTLFVTMLTAIQVLIHRYTGQNDVTVGTVSANRSRPELAALIGYLVNTLPIRTDMTGDPTFVDLLQKVRSATVEAYAHQDLPFAKLVEALRIQRDPSRSPLFQIGFTMAEAADGEIRAGDITIQPETVDILPAKVDLHFFIETLPAGGMRVSLSYAKALFDETTAHRMLEHLRVLTTGIAADPTRRLSQLPLVTPAEAQRELVEWNDTSAAYPVMCVHQSFEEQVERSPRRIAAVSGDEQWTYAQLNGHANQIARMLHQHGVVAETLVGISMRPSLRRLAAVLGVLKAGGGYVPLDPDLPPERLGFMVQDAGMAIIIADTNAPPLATTTAEIVDLQQHWPEIARQPIGNPNYPVTPHNVAYVIYTSGSTGRPKGVIVEHASVVNYINGMIQLCPVVPEDRLLQFASLSFDVSVLDMFAAVCSGAMAVFGPVETLHSPPRLAALMRHHRVTFACLPPAVVNLLADESLPDLRILISAGEALPSDLVARWLRPGLVFCNGYGPTETTCGATLMKLDATTALPPPIGRPMPNYTAYVLDAHLNPVPLGAIGELHIGGLGVARGYLNQPALTQQRFIPDPYSNRANARLYRTGDLVRRLPEGTIQFVGRVDTQVKIRGLRVELGEIEVALTTHPAVVQALVIAVDDPAGQKQLIGYARTEPGAAVPSSADLRQHLARQLPGYMIPSQIVLLDEFPLNSSGKIDRRALPTPDLATISSTAPRTLIETLLVDLYASVLHRPHVGIDDSFFDIGGNSLQAMQLVSRLHTELAVDTDVTAIFLAPTPHQLAALLRDKHGLEDADLGDEGLDGLAPLADQESPPGVQPAIRNGPLVELTNGPGQSPLFIVHAISGTVHPYAQLAKELAGSYKVYGIEAAGLTREENATTVTTLDQMVSTYTDAIRAAQPTGLYRLAGWSMGGMVAFEIARTLEALGETVALLVLLDAPYALPPDPPATEAELAALFVADVARLLGWLPDTAAAADAVPAPDPLAWLTARLAAGPDADHLGWLTERLAAGPGEIDTLRAEIERRFAVYRANALAIAGYRPNTRVHASALIAGAESTWDSAPDWQTAIDGPVYALRMPGEHYSLLQPPSVQRIASAIAELDTVQRMVRLSPKQAVIPELLGPADVSAASAAGHARVRVGN